MQAMTICKEDHERTGGRQAMMKRKMYCTKKVTTQKTKMVEGKQQQQQQEEEEAEEKSPVLASPILEEWGTRQLPPREGSGHRQSTPLQKQRGP